MVKLFILAIFVSILKIEASNLIDFVEGLAVGYGLDATCTSSIDSASSAWTTYQKSIPTSKGSGQALYNLHDFTLALTTASNNCNLLQIASLIDQAFNTNLLATLIRFVASYSEIYQDYQLYKSAWQTGLYNKAGQYLGEIINYLID